MGSLIRTYRYRLYPTRTQEATLRSTLFRLRELYNGALQERRDAYKKQGVFISCSEQRAELKLVRAELPEYRAIYNRLLRDTIERLDRAFKDFFRRVRTGQKPGFPRFQGHGRYNSFTFPEAVTRQGAVLDLCTKRIRLFGIGEIKIKLHRKPDGRLKRVTIKLDGDGHWYAYLCCDNVPLKPLVLTGATVGVDVGLNAFAALSDGTLIANPRYYERSQQALRRKQRTVERRKRGSRRRRKALATLRSHHDRIRRTRLDFHRKVAVDLVRRFDSIAVENLSPGISRGYLAKQIQDAGWAQFISILQSKAEESGREVVKVDPRGTSQRCSGCGTVVPKKLSVRIHDCPNCGLVLDRDLNAARNIESLGHSDRGGLANGLA